MQQQQPQPPPAATQSQPGTQAQPATQSQPAQSQAQSPAPAPAQPRFNPQQVTPVVQLESARTTNEVGVADVLVNSFALIGFLIAAALIVGLVTGGIFIAIRRWRDKNSPDSNEPTATRLKLS
jgi:outer membrane biosynthesis protein TonB